METENAVETAFMMPAFLCYQKRSVPSVSGLFLRGNFECTLQICYGERLWDLRQFPKCTRAPGIYVSGDWRASGVWVRKSIKRSAWE